jgi:uncharacterized protein YjiS (DUF1127 family)
MARPFEHAPLETLIGRPLPPVSAALFNLARIALVWEQRRQTRRAMARLDGHMVRDIGLTADMVADEVGKPFWRD